MLEKQRIFTIYLMVCFMTTWIINRMKLKMTDLFVESLHLQLQTHWHLLINLMFLLHKCQTMLMFRNKITLTTLIQTPQINLFLTILNINLMLIQQCLLITMMPCTTTIHQMLIQQFLNLNSKRLNITSRSTQQCNF